MKLSLVSAIIIAALYQRVALAQKLFTQLEELTDRNFGEKIKPTDEDVMWLVTFYVPWCPHAQAFAPKLEAVAESLKSHSYTINFAAVDVSTNPQLGQYYRINSSPIIKMLSYHEGKEVIEDFVPEGDGDNITEFCQNSFRKKNIPYTDLPEDFEDGSIITLDDTNYDDVILSSNEIWFIMFGAEWCYHCKLAKPGMAAAALELGPKVRFAIIDADKNRGLAKRHKISKLPTLKYYQAGYGKTDDTIVKYSGGRTAKEILTFTNDLHAEFIANPVLFAYIHDSEVAKDVPEPIHISDFEQSALPTEIKEQCTDDSLCVLAFLPQGLYRQNQINDMTTLLNTIGHDNGVSLFWIEQGEYANCENSLGLRHDEPQVIAFRAGESTYRRMDTTFTVGNCQNFISTCQEQGVRGTSLPEGGISLKAHLYTS